MKILLINPTGTSGIHTWTIPQGLVHICSEARRAGHECEILNLCAEGETFSSEKPAKFDVVGISAMSSQLRHAAEIAGSLPKGVKAVWGGPHCAIDPESILNAWPEHFVVRGEGERPMASLLEFFEGRHDTAWLEQQPGICFVNGARTVVKDLFVHENADAPADADYRTLPHLDKYIFRHDFFFRRTVPALRLVTSRGCPWNCNFCIYSTFGSRHPRLRRKSMEKIRRETESIIDEYGIKLILPVDDDFFGNPGLADDVAAYAREKDFLWGANCRFNYIGGPLLGAEKLRSLVDSGLCLLTMSVEAGDETSRNKILNKQITNAEISRAAEILHGIGGGRPAVHTNFLINFPGEAPQNKFETLRCMDLLSRRLNVLFHGPLVYMDFPGSKIYNENPVHIHGDLNYYIEHLTGAGMADTTPPPGFYENYFYTEFARHHFSRGMKFLKMTKRPDGGTDYETEPAPATIKQKIGARVKRLMFISVALRLRLNIRCFFIEPRLFNNGKKLLDAITGRTRRPSGETSAKAHGDIGV